MKGTGAAVIRALVEVAQARGVDIQWCMPVKRILKTGYDVATVVAEEDGDELEVCARDGSGRERGRTTGSGSASMGEAIVDGRKPRGRIEQGGKTWAGQRMTQTL